MKKFLMIILTVALGLGLALGDAPLIHAQESDTAEFTLEEITVTAQKREENQQKVGIAMEVLTGEQLKELGRYDLDQILQNVSTATIQRTADGLRIGLRGVTYDTPAGYGDGTGATPGTVSVMTDGVFSQRNPTGTGLYDIERVEVLYGPQTTTYASNAPGGIVNIEIARPKTDAFELSGTLEYGNYNLLHGEGMVNAPLNDKFALRASGTGTVRDGYISNGGDDEDSKSGRLRALWEPNDKFSFLITGQYLESESRGFSSVMAFADQDDVDDPWFSDQEITGPPTKTDQTKFWGNIQWDFGYGTLTLIPSTTDNDFYRTSTTVTETATPAGTVEYRNFGQSKGWDYEDGFEARIGSPDDSRIKWMLVYNYYKGEVHRDQRTDHENPDLIADITEMHLLLSNEAFLGNITYPVTDRFRVLAGARYSSDRAMSSRTTIQTSGMGRDTYSDMTYSAPDYKIGVEYDVSADSMFFATFATSYRVEQEAMQWDGSTLPPQEMNAYTAGIKNRFLDNKVQVNAAAYFYDYTNRVHQAMQFPTIAMPPTPPFSYCDPDAQPGDPNYAPVCGGFRPDEGGRVPGDLEMKGMEVQTSVIMTTQDKLDISIAYLDSWITHMIANFEFKDQPYATPEASDFSNRTPTHSPEWTITLNYSHNFNLPNGGVLTARFDSKFQSEYEVDWWESRGGVDQTLTKHQEPHHIDNFTAVYAHPDGKWTLSGYVKNAWNYAEKRFLNMMGAYNTTIGPPRTFGMILSVRY